MSTPSTITGKEAAEAGDSPIAALIDFYRAFNNRDLALMEANWSASGESSMSNPLGGIRRGWADIRGVYERLFQGPTKVYVEYYDYSIIDGADSFCAVGRERGLAERDGQKLELAIRTSRVYRREEIGWRQVHHHGSMDDPALLARYQTLVMGGAQP